MYYRHDGKFNIVEKSSTELLGDNILTSEMDFDLELYDVVIGYELNGVILKHTKRLRGTDVVEKRLTDIQETQAQYSIDLDYRLSVLELGLNTTV